MACKTALPGIALLTEGERMKKRAINTAIATAVVGFLTVGTVLAGSASAANSAPSPKEKAAVSAYAKTMAQAGTAYFAAVKPTRVRALAVGKSAEKARRAKVQVALVAFNSVVVAAKAPSLAAEKSYKAAWTKSAANPASASLKASAKAALLALTQATAALKTDARVASSHAAFAKARVAAMTQFKATVAKSVKARDLAQIRAIAKFKAVKVKALATLKAAVKAARAKP
jgi:hypothetical protein